MVLVPIDTIDTIDTIEQVRRNRYESSSIGQAALRVLQGYQAQRGDTGDLQPYPEAQAAAGIVRDSFKGYDEGGWHWWLVNQRRGFAMRHLPFALYRCHGGRAWHALQGSISPEIKSWKFR
jgi:hypothetical protein